MKKILTLSLVLVLGANLACQQKTKPDLQARRDSIKVDSLSSLPAVLFNTALEAEKKQVGKAKKLYAKLAKDSTFWGEQARLRLEFLSTKEVKDMISRAILGTWQIYLTKTPWSEKLYHYEDKETELLKIYANGTAEWFEKGSVKRKTSYKLYDGELSKVPLKDDVYDVVGDMKNPHFQCLILFEQGGFYILRQKHDTMSLSNVYCCDCGEIVYRRTE